MKVNRINQIIVLLLLFGIVLPAVTLYGVANPAGADATEAEKLIEKAKYHYGQTRDYTSALTVLDAAILEAETPVIKAEALIHKAYVCFLMKKKIAEYKSLIEEALKNNPTIKADPMYFYKTFVEIFNLVTRNPGDLEEQIKLVFNKSVTKKYKHPKGKKFFVKAGVSYLLAMDKRFRDVYSSGQIQPHLGVGYMAGKLVYFWADYKFFSTSNLIPESDLTTTLTKSFLSGGIGFIGHFSKKMDFKVQLGLGKYSYKEEAMDINVSGSLIGYNIDGSVLFNVGRFLYLEASLGFRSGRKGGFEPGQLSMDGLQSGLCLEYRF